MSIPSSLRSHWNKLSTTEKIVYPSLVLLAPTGATAGITASIAAVTFIQNYRHQIKRPESLGIKRYKGLRDLTTAVKLTVLNPFKSIQKKPGPKRPSGQKHDSSKATTDSPPTYQGL